MKSRILILSSLVLILNLFGVSQVDTATGQMLARPQTNGPESLVFSFKAPALQLAQDTPLAQPTLEGFEASGMPGDPLLPVKAFNIALPPDVVPESVKAQVVLAPTIEQTGTYQIAPAPPSKTWVEDQEVTLWGENASSIVDGKNIQVYQTDAYFPASQLSSVRFDQMRKWRFINLLLTPLQYNPVTGKLRLASEIQVRVTFERSTSLDQRQLQLELSDTVMDKRAAELLYNYDQARPWYPVMAKPTSLLPTYNYVIITTNFIVANNNKLNSFNFSFR